MSDSRVSNKQLLSAIEGIAPAIATALAGIAAPTKAPVVVAEPVVETPDAPSGDIKIGAEYLKNRKGAAQAHADKTGQAIMLYARRNLAGETKLAYAVEARFNVLKDNGLIGPVQLFTPSA